MVRRGRYGRRMGIEFAGYAGDCRIFGRVASLGERLTDLLNAGDRVVVRDARLVSLVDGHTIEVPECPVEATELCAAIAHGPRGLRTHRVRTDQHRIRLGVGPYLVLGELHSPPDADPIADVLRRPAMVPLTNATITYQLAGRPEAEDVGTIIVNRLLTEWIAPVGGAEEAFPGVRVVRRMRLKDFTGATVD